MSGKKLFRLAAVLTASAAVLTGTAEASLVAFQSFNGKVAVSSDGYGGSGVTGVISASAPTGSKVVAAYLYTATQSAPSGLVSGVTLNGSNVNYTNNFVNTSATYLASNRADVTSIVKPIIDAGAGGVYNFDIAEGAANSSIDGSALVVVYENAALPTATVGILDGFAALGGDTTAINFADPLNTSDPNFFASMYLGINFSCCNQASTVNVNGQLLTQNAGNNDDGLEQQNGSLITVGGFDDPFAPINPSYAADKEKYDLKNILANGVSSIIVDTVNPSNDDNIFLALFHVAGLAGINEPPPPDPSGDVPLPAAFWLLGSGIGAAFYSGRKKRKS